MPSKTNRVQMRSEQRIIPKLIFWSIFGFVIKLIIILNIQPVNININDQNFISLNGIWAGSDAEGYLTGYSSLILEGIFSKNSSLNYWPAGYPLIIFAISIFSGMNWLIVLSILQSAFFTFSVFYFAIQISRTRLRKYTFFAYFLISFNPVLSLTSLWIGYENLVASGFILMLGVILKDLQSKDSTKFIRMLTINSLISGILVFVQPRFVLTVVIINLIWIIYRQNFRQAALFALLSIGLTLLFPASLIYRNYQATGLMVISTNLGSTMNLGAGDKATGTYRSEGQGVDCDVTGLNPAEADSKRINCVLDWYLNNPGKTVKLFFNKSKYFWSPWVGPEGGGTMGRNPWLKIHPINDIASSQDGARLVFGNFGKVLSWSWIVGGLILIFYGFLLLWKQKGLERLIGLLAILVVSINWMISLMTIGDHRFRVPIMGMSLFLQAIGLKTLLGGGKLEMVEKATLR
jgi:hypothetical protein